MRTWWSTPGPNAVARPDTDVIAADAGVAVLVVASREDLQIAAGVEAALDGRRS